MKRDAHLDRLFLLMPETRRARTFLREAEETLRAAFPLSTRGVLAALDEGRDPGADGIVVL